MLDMEKALDYLKSELDRVNHTMGIVEVMAATKNQKRRQKAMREAAKFLTANKIRSGKHFTPAARLDATVCH